MLNFGRFQDFLYRFLFENQTEILQDSEMIIKEINAFKHSRRRLDMINGERYYEGKHDIIHRKREVIGVNGKLEEVDNLPNNHIIDNQYAKMVNQKKNYLLGQPLTFNTDNKQYSEALKEVFNMRFMRTMKNLLEDALNEGIAWLFVGYDEHWE